MTITTEHPEYKRRKGQYRQFRDLYVGGEQIRTHASEYLMRRSKEPRDIYEQRLSRVFYENYAGSIIDWYGATLFRREPVLSFDAGSESSRRFFREFAEDCSLTGTNFTDFFRKQFVDTLVFGSSYTLIDFPRVQDEVRTRADEDATGASRAYLVSYTPEQLINWTCNDRGEFDRVVLRSSQIREKNDGTGYEECVSYLEYDRKAYRLYQGTSEEQEPQLIREGKHGMAGLNVVPLLEMKVQEGLWLMNKAASLQLEHFNKSNALAWAITMGLFAMPIVYSEKPWEQIVGESYFIQMGSADRFGWTEPEGKVYQIAADNLTRLKDEVYRICYLSYQAGGGSGAVPQSALSKLRDFAIAQEVLRGYGDLVKDSMKRVLRAIASARCDETFIDVSGMDEFDIADFRSDLEDAEQLLRLGIQSPTLIKQVYKRLAHKYLCDARQEIKDSISAEIDQQIGIQ